MQEVWRGFGMVIVYFVIAASSALVLRKLTAVPDEVFRKLLHCILLGSLAVWIAVFDTWWLAALTAVVFALAVYPLLSLGERIKGYSHLLTERKTGEIKRSLLVVFFMFAVVVCVCWGWLQDRMLVLASIYAWGFGDAAAALVGKRFGKHPLQWKKIDGRKSAEGTLAMFVVSLCSVTLLLALRGQMPWYGVAVTATVTALVSAAVELYTPGGMDTITCPLAAMCTLLPLTALFGGIGR